MASAAAEDVARALRDAALPLLADLAKAHRQADLQEYRKHVIVTLLDLLMPRFPAVPLDVIGPIVAESVTVMANRMGIDFNAIVERLLSPPALEEHVPDTERPE